MREREREREKERERKRERERGREGGREGEMLTLVHATHLRTVIARALWT